MESPCAKIIIRAHAYQVACYASGLTDCKYVVPGKRECKPDRSDHLVLLLKYEGEKLYVWMMQVDHET